MRITTHDLPTLSSYQRAFDYWETRKPWRGETGEYDPRPLADRKKRHMSIRKSANGDILIRLYHTNVLVYHPDGTITVTAYRSASTDAFVRSVGPDTISTRFNTQGLMYLLLQSGMEERSGNGWGPYHYPSYTAYGMNGSMTIRREEGYWVPTTPGLPINDYSLDKPKANAALKRYGYRDFALWLKSYEVMRGDKAKPWRPTPSDDALLAMLMDQGQWQELAGVPNILRLLRDLIYAREDCIRHIALPCAPAHELDAIHKRQQLYG